MAAYQNGSWREIFQTRMHEFAAIQFGWIFIGPTIAAMFLLGLWLGRRGILQRPEVHVRLLRGVTWIGLPVGLGLNIGYALGTEVTNPAVPSFAGMLTYGGQWLGAPLLGFGYAASLVLLMRDERWRRRLGPLGAVGRMALTNYLLQTLICTTIFYSYGLALFNRVGPALTVPLALAIYAAQIAVSVWWLRRFRFGPMEWLWRTLTYGKLQPMRLPA